MKKNVIGLLCVLIGLVLFANVAVAADTTPPTVSVNSPSNNATVRGVANVDCYPKDDVKVTKGEIYIDNVLKPATFQAYNGYTYYSWDTRVEAAGNHTIYCKAYDAAGNFGISTVRSVIVDKTPDITPPVIMNIRPANDAKISGIEDFSPLASDDSGLIVKDELYFDGQLISAHENLTIDLQGKMYFTINTSKKLVNGPHTFYFKVYDSDGNVATSPTSAITVYNAPPVVNVISPVSGSTVSRIAHITAQASTPSSISSIEIYYDGISICRKVFASLSKIPNKSITCDWDTGTAYNKVHQITAQASDETGVKTLSPAISITTNNIPGEFRFTSPANGAAVSGMVPIGTFASSANSTEFYLDGTSIRGLQSCATCNFSWNSTTVGNGPHALKARAFWNGAFYETTETVNVNNNGNTDITAPTVSMTNPPAISKSYTKAQTVVVKATAGDNVGVAKVEFYIDNVLKGTDTASPYEYNWAITAADSGEHGLLAKAYDAAGNNNSSLGKGVTVDIVTSDIVAPTVYLSAPAVDTIYTAPRTVTINATASDRFGVTKVVFYDGSTILGTNITSPYDSKYSWSVTTANNGKHILTAKAYDAAGNVGTSGFATVTVNIASGGDTANPTVSLTAPANNTNYSSTQTISVSAAATDNVGVDRVEFYDGTAKLGTVNYAPYTYAWPITAANNGSHSLTAKAYDAAGNVGTSVAVNVAVNIVTTDTQSPAVNITAPSNNASYTTAQTVNINATASDNVGVAKVEFYDGSTKLGTGDTSSPYEYAWPITAANNGTHSLTAKAYDAAGNSKVSTAVNVTVNIVTADTQSPAVSISAPSNNASYTTAQTVNISATASDNVGVTKVEFYDGTAKLGTISSAPYTYAWPITAVNNGSHSLTAKAYDAVGNSKVSNAVNVTVNIATGCMSNAACDDGIYCNGAETCQSGKCVKGVLVTCNDSNACTSDTCSETAKACAYSLLSDNTSCASGVCCVGACKAGAATCSGTGAGTVCWNGSNQNLYLGQAQLKKFCLCAQGTYSYKDYNRNTGNKPCWYYASAYNTENWAVKSLTTLSTSSAICSDGKTYYTNQTYTYPK